MGTKDKMIKLRLSNDQLEILDRYSAAINESRSETIRTLINFAYENALFLKPEAIETHDPFPDNRLIDDSVDYYGYIVPDKYDTYKRYRRERRKIIRSYPKDIVEIVLEHHDEENSFDLDYCNVELQRFYDDMEQDYEFMYYPPDEE